MSGLRFELSDSVKSTLDALLHPNSEDYDISDGDDYGKVCVYPLGRNGR